MDLDITQVDYFQNSRIPVDCMLAGLAALVYALDVNAPVRQPACISKARFRESTKIERDWKVFDSKFKIEPTLASNLLFAMRHESMDLLVLKRIFQKIPKHEIEEQVRATPVGIHIRRLWFLYEFLLDQTLDLDPVSKVKYVDLLDEENYFTIKGLPSARHAVRNNLLGSKSFCPIIRRTPTLQSYIKQDLANQALQTIRGSAPALVARAASFLMLADSQASFQIEGEKPASSRIDRWGKAVLQSGRNPLNESELQRLHSILIEDNRYIPAGFRQNGVFLGEHTSDGYPMPEFIGARFEDLATLMSELIHVNNILRTATLDPVLQAAAIAFGFIYIHPFVDGNGRLHRCIIHHVLADKKFSPPSLLFPVSSAMLRWIDLYRNTLRNHSSKLMPHIKWKATSKGNVDVQNDTADLYRYYDCTEAAEFLYKCVEQTIKVDLPNEIEFLKRRDEAVKSVMEIVEMPDNLADRFVLYTQRNTGKLPKKRREEFHKLTEEEIEQLEEAVQEAFEGFDASASSLLE